jgi:ribosomal protein S18 acetylase RimI-like enzyme
MSGPRTATLDDLRELARIKAVVSRRAYSALMSSDELQWWLDAACSPEHFKALLDDPKAAVLIEDTSRAVGTVRFEEAAYISDVYVAHPGMGAGRRIVETLLTYACAAGQASAECSVMAWSPGAIAFWEAMGFRRGRFATQQPWDPDGLMRRDGTMHSRTLATEYLAYVRALRTSPLPAQARRAAGRC